MSFIDAHILSDISWQGFERLVERLLLVKGYDNVRAVGQTADGGADILATRFGKRWLFQVKRWNIRVGGAVVDRTLEASRAYRADIPVIVSLSGFDSSTQDTRRRLLDRGVPIQLWDRAHLLREAAALQPPARPFGLRPYQTEAIEKIVEAAGDTRRVLIALATGLGKTVVASEAYARLSREHSKFRALVIAHTNELVYQLERAFWRAISPGQQTAVWNGLERPDEHRLYTSDVIFACLPTLAEYVKTADSFPRFDMVIVDECHHAGSAMYHSVLDAVAAGRASGPTLVGLTATPWRADEQDLAEIFGDPALTVDLITGLRQGYLANVDYRVFTDNIDWAALNRLRSGELTPRRINRTFFIDQWDDGVIDAMAEAWKEQTSPRAIVFCGTIEHALTMRDKLNARRFCVAEAIYSGPGAGGRLTPVQRNRTLSDFADNKINVVCAVDIFNEGIDVPDVNILVFQRVTHSRRIFVQQLGRGLRLAEGKSKVIVLDFVSDIRRFAANLELKDQVDAMRTNKPVRVSLPSTVTFRRVAGPDSKTETFLRQWLEDVVAVEDAGEDAHVLRFPPELN